MVFPVVMNGCESWDYTESWVPKNWCFWTMFVDLWLDKHTQVQSSRSVVSDSVRPHGVQHARPPCPSSVPRTFSNSHPLSRWCHPTISSSVVPFSSCPHLSQHQGLFKVELFQILKDDAVKVLHSICQQIWKTQQWPQDLKRSVFNPIPKKGNAKECSNYHKIALISHASKVMLKILQARLQQYVKWELPNVQAGFSKGRGTRDQIANIRWIIEKAREFQKNMYFCFTDYAKAFYCVDHNRLWKILKEMGIPDHLTCLLRNLYAGQKAAVRTRHWTTGSFKTGE